VQGDGRCGALATDFPGAPLERQQVGKPKVLFLIFWFLPF
jgi:hypothetical protein